MGSTKRHHYICGSCGETSMFEKEPCFCPFCGSSDFKRNQTKARKRANEIIKEMQDILPRIESSWNEYVECYAEFENRRRMLDSYARRGVIDRDSIPKAEKKKLVEALYEYRETRRKNG